MKPLPLNGARGTVAAVLSFLLVGAAVGGTTHCSSDSNPADSVVTDDNSPGGEYVGQLAGENDLAGKMELTLTASTAATTSLHPLATSPYGMYGVEATLTLNIINVFKPVHLTGTVDAVTGNATFTGGIDYVAHGRTYQITFTGTFVDGVLSGTYFVPFIGRGSFVVTKKRVNLHNFCGRFTGSQEGRWVVYTQNTWAGGVFAGSPMGLQGALSGTVAGSAVQLKLGASGMANGTIAGSVLSGQWTDGAGASGMFSADEAACGTLPPGPMLPADDGDGGTDAGGDASTGASSNTGDAGGDAANDASSNGSGDAGTEAGSDAADAAVDSGPPLPLPAPTTYWSFDTATINGTTLNAVGSGVPGTLNAGVTSVAGKLGQALSFDGVTGAVDFGDVFDDAIAGAGSKFSAAMWVNVPGPFTGSGMNGYAPLLAKTGGGGSGVCANVDEREFFFGILDNGKLYTSYSTQFDAINQFGIKATTVLTTGAWHHVVLTYDQSATTGVADRLALYLDGALEADNTYEYPVNAPFMSTHAIGDGPAHLALGSTISSLGPCGFYLKGLLDEYAFWKNRVLTASEVTSLYNWGKDGKAIAP